MNDASLFHVILQYSQLLAFLIRVAFSQVFTVGTINPRLAAVESGIALLDWTLLHSSAHQMNKSAPMPHIFSRALF